MTTTTNKPQIAPEPEQEEEAALSIVKPDAFDLDLDRFRSKRAPTIAGVATLQTALPVHRMSESRDFVRLHHDEKIYWSVELCFVRVPTPGQRRDTLHLIDEDLAMQYLESADIIRCRLALAAKPDGSFYLNIVPSQNLDNAWNADNLQGCEAAKTRWTKLSSRRDESAEGYKITYALDEDAFAEPNWPAQSLSELIGVTFRDRMIVRADHPGLLRLIGARQSLK
jgi:hypothetical protein